MFSVAVLLLLATGSCVKCEQLTQPASVTVQPGQRLTITCQVSYSVSGYWTGWIRQPAGKGLEWIGVARVGQTTHYKDSLKNKFSISTESSSNTVTLNGQNVQPEDSAVYYCARGGGSGAFDYWGKGTMVTVSSATSTKPTVFPLIPCGSGTGDTVTLGCFATGFTPSSAEFSWTKNGAALTEFIQYPPVQKGEYYTRVSQIQVKRQDWDGKQSFQCGVAHPAGNGQSGIIKPPDRIYRMPTVKVLKSEEGTEVSFSCFAKGFSPREEYDISWLENEGKVNNKIYEIKTPLQSEKNENETLYSAASFLAVQSSGLPHGTKFTCVFKGKTEKGHEYKNDSLTYGPSCSSQGCPKADVDVKIVEPSLEEMFLNRKGQVTCVVTVNTPSVNKIYWEGNNGNDIVGTTLIPNPGVTGTFKVHLPVTYDEWSLGIQSNCIVEHSDWLTPKKTAYERKPAGQLQRPSVFMMPPVEQTKTQTVTLTCYVKDFYPKEVYVSWLVDDEAAGSNYKFHTTNPIENNGVFSAYSQLSLGLDQWKNNDMVYSCEVHHESVANSTKAIVRSIGHRTFQQTNLVNLNMNIPEKCKAQ